MLKSRFRFRRGRPREPARPGIGIAPVLSSWVAHNLEETLASSGSRVVGPVAPVAGPITIILSNALVQGAVLDISLQDERVFPVARRLKAEAIPFIFVTV